MIDPRENDIPLTEIAQRYFDHSEKTMRNWVSNRNNPKTKKKYPFPIYQYKDNGPWFVSRKNFAEYQRQKIKDAETLHSINKKGA